VIAYESAVAAALLATGDEAVAAGATAGAMKCGAARNGVIAAASY
jgi:hypothetical protein